MITTIAAMALMTPAQVATTPEPPAVISATAAKSSSANNGGINVSVKTTTSYVGQDYTIDDSYSWD